MKLLKLLRRGVASCYTSAMKLNLPDITPQTATYTEAKAAGDLRSIALLKRELRARIDKGREGTHIRPIVLNQPTSSARAFDVAALNARIIDGYVPSREDIRPDFKTIADVSCLAQVAIAAHNLPALRALWPWIRVDLTVQERKFEDRRRERKGNVYVLIDAAVQHHNLEALDFMLDDPNLSKEILFNSLDYFLDKYDTHLLELDLILQKTAPTRTADDNAWLAGMCSSHHQTNFSPINVLFAHHGILTVKTHSLIFFSMLESVKQQVETWKAQTGQFPNALLARRSFPEYKNFEKFPPIVVDKDFNELVSFFGCGYVHDTPYQAAYLCMLLFGNAKNTLTFLQRLSDNGKEDLHSFLFAGGMPTHDNVMHFIETKPDLRYWRRWGHVLLNCEDKSNAWYAMRSAGGVRKLRGYERALVKQPPWRSAKLETADQT